MKNLKILFADQDVMDRKAYGHTLLNDFNNECEIYETDRGDTTLEFCRNQDLDCIIIGYLFPDMNGIDLIKALKSNGDFTTPIIMLTSRGDEGVAVRALKEGAADYVTKNQKNQDNLAKTILNAIEKSALENKIQEQEEKLKKLAYYDSLTGVMNRIAFIDAAKRAIADTKKNQQLLAILYIDLDNFKAVNDTLGHLGGDELLQAISKRLTNLLRKDDILARLGGDEFVLLLPRLGSLTDAEIVAKKIIENSKPPYQIGANNAYINISIGIAHYPECGKNLNELLKSADFALYRAKQLGRGSIQFFNDEIKQTYQKKLIIETGLHTAIEKQEFFLVYQPIFNLKTETIVGMETLLRWQHPVYGIMAPDQFIKIAEESGLIIPIGKWVIENACQQFEYWHKLCANQLSLSVAINLSPSELSNSQFFDTLTDVLNKTSLPPECIQLEITELGLIEFAQHETMMQNLRGISLQLAIDNFGRGYSSLEKIKKMPVTSLKIDSSLVHALTHGEPDEAIVKSIIHIGQDLGLKVSAEGIETKDQLKALVKLNCPFGQGFYFSEPVRADRMTEFLVKHLEGKKLDVRG